MKKDIYSMLNSVSTDTSVYAEEKLSEAELQVFKGNLQKRLLKGRRRKIAYAIVVSAACVAVAAIVYLLPRVEQMQASEKKTGPVSDSRAGAAANIEQEKVQIQKHQKFDGGSVTLQSLAVGEGQLTVDTVYYFENDDTIPQSTEGTWWRDYDSSFEETCNIMNVPVRSTDFTGYEELDEEPYIQRIYMNGEEVRCLTDAYVFAKNKGILQDTANYYFPVEQLDYPVQMRLEIWKDPAQEEPAAVFETEIKEEDLLENEMEVDLSQTMETKSGSVWKFERFIYNAQGVKIYAREENAESDAAVSLLQLCAEFALGNGMESTNRMNAFAIGEQARVFLPSTVEDLYYYLRGDDGKSRGILELKIEESYLERNTDGELEEKETLIQDQKVRIPLQ